jgi:hypothetical protein
MNDWEHIQKEDIGRIIYVLHKDGYKVTPSQAQRLWEQHSEQVCASWLTMPPDDSRLLALLLDQLRHIPLETLAELDRQTALRCLENSFSAAGAVELAQEMRLLRVR